MKNILNTKKASTIIILICFGCVPFMNRQMRGVYEENIQIEFWWGLFVVCSLTFFLNNLKPKGLFPLGGMFLFFSIQFLAYKFPNVHSFICLLFS